MPKSARPRLADVRAVFLLAGECRDLGDDAVGWRRHWFAGLARLAVADLALGGELGGLTAGAPRDLGTAEWGWENGFDRTGWTRALTFLADDPRCSLILGRYAAASAGHDGAAAARPELAADTEWYRSAEYDLIYRAGGVDHHLWCLRSVPGGRGEVNGGVLLRGRGRPGFTARQTAVVEEAYRTIGPLVGGPLARFADPSPTALSPRARQVLKCLLEGDGDKQVAARLRIALHTVNQYAKLIFRHFGVSSRAELLARWVRRGWGGRFAWADDGPG